MNEVDIFSVARLAFRRLGDHHASLSLNMHIIGGEKLCCANCMLVIVCLSGHGKR